MTIKSRPSEARVYIDNLYKGVTPLEIELSEGRYHLSLKKDGFEPSSNSIVVQGAKLQTVDDSLFAVSKLKIDTSPDAFNVYIDSSFAGKTPIENFVIASGKHHLRIYREGYKEISANITIKPGENPFIKYILRPVYSLLTLNVLPPDARVILDSTEVEQGNFSKIKIQSGIHDIKVFHPGFKNSLHESVYVAPGVECEVTAPLNKFSAKAALFSLVVPGLGQVLDGSYLKGSLEFAGALGMGYVVYSAFDYKRQKDNELGLATVRYELAQTELETITARENLSRASSNLTTAKSRVLMSAAGLGAVYIFTIIDALIFHSTHKYFYINNTLIPYPGMDRFRKIEDIELGATFRL